MLHCPKRRGYCECATNHQLNDEALLALREQGDIVTAEVGPFGAGFVLAQLGEPSGPLPAGVRSSETCSLVRYTEKGSMSAVSLGKSPL